jgi:hypothetical protein
MQIRASRLDDFRVQLAERQQLAAPVRPEAPPFLDCLERVNLAAAIGAAHHCWDRPWGSETSRELRSQKSTIIGAGQVAQGAARTFAFRALQAGAAAQRPSGASL